MISYKSIKSYLIINGLSIGLTFFLYMMYLFNIWTGWLLLIKNFFLVYFIKWIISDKKDIVYTDINSRKIPESSYYCEFQLDIIKETFTEYLTYLIIYYFYGLIQSDIYYDLLIFIPKSFIFEIIFDFFHYVIHRMCHTYPLLYKLIHKKHHKFINPSSETAHYSSMIDQILTKTVPFLITAYFLRLSIFEFILYHVYKTYQEIAGHCGKHMNTSNFPQFVWLPRLLGIELLTIHHDVHHYKVNYNYSKRFSLWDKLFRTFYDVE